MIRTRINTTKNILLNQCFYSILFKNKLLLQTKKKIIMAGKIKRFIIRPIRDFAMFHFLHSIFEFHRLLPRKLILAWHGFAAKGVYYLFPQSRRNIIENLTFVFGKEKTSKEINKMGQDLFVTLSKTFTDYAFFSSLTTREQFSKYFKIEGEEYLKEAYAKGKGVLCLIPHTPCWEFSAILPPILGYSTTAVSRTIRNPALNKLMVHYRQSRGMKNISRSHCYDALLKALSKGDCMIIMIDQDSKHIRGEFIPFFGKPAYTPLGCARLAMDSGAPILPMYTIRNDDDTYLFKILPEVPLLRTSDKGKDMVNNTAIHNQIIENIIRQHPSQWVWMHRRWDTTPESLKEYLNKKKQRQIKQKESI